MTSPDPLPWPPPGAPLPPERRGASERIGLTLTVAVALAPLAGLGICAQYAHRAWRGLGIRPGDLPISLSDIAPAASFIGFWVLVGAVTVVGALFGLERLVGGMNRTAVGRSFDRVLDRPVGWLGRLDRGSRRVRVVIIGVAAVLIALAIVVLRDGYRRYIDSLYETARSADVFLLHSRLSLLAGVSVGLVALATVRNRVFGGLGRAVFAVGGMYGLFLTSVITIDLADLPRLKLETATSSSAGLLPFNLGAGVRYVDVVPVGAGVATATGLADARCVVTFGAGPSGIVLRAVAENGSVDVWKIDPQLVILRNAPACSEADRRTLWTSSASRAFPG